MINRKQQPALKKIETIDIPEPEVARLDNGVPVYLFGTNETGITKLDFIFDAGSRYQAFPLVASYTNKMLTEGTQTYTSYEVARKLDYYGAWINKATSKDSAVVSLSVISKHLKYVMPVLNEIINFPEFPAKELRIHTQKDKQVFIDDCRKVNEVAVMNFNRQLFGDRHPYGTIISADDFDGINRKQLKDFHHEKYTGGNCSIVVSGKIAPELLTQLNYFFGTGKKAKAEKATSSTNKIVSGVKKQFIEMPDTVQCALRVGKVGINKAHKDFIGLFILNTILGGYFGSRLMKNIREDKGYTYGIYSTLISFQQSAAFLIASEVGAGVCGKALEEIYKELKTINSEPVSIKELELVKRYLTGTILRSFDGPFETAERFIGLLKFDVDYKKYYADFFRTLNTIGPDDLLLISQKYLMASDMLELVVGKK